MRVNLLAILMITLCAGVLAGCGSSDDSSSSSGDDARSASTSTEGSSGDQQHLDGTIAFQGDQLVLTAEGRAPITMDLADDVDVAPLRALAATNANTRVTFEPATGDKAAVAVAVHEIKPHENDESYEGAVTKVNENSITLKGDDGEKTYALAPTVAEEVEHLNEHANIGSPIRVYLEVQAGTPTVIAYEDA